MIRITRETDYSIVLLTTLAQLGPEESLSATALAKQCHLPLPMVGKVLKTLAHANILNSQRGAHGGYSLARPATAISITEIVEALEGPIAITECSVQDDACAYQAHCGVSAHWSRINVAIREALQGISLHEMSNLPPIQIGYPDSAVIYQAERAQ